MSLISDMQDISGKISNINEYTNNLKDVFFSQGGGRTKDLSILTSEIQSWTTTQLAGVSTLAGNNSFTGSNTFTGHQYITGDSTSTLYFKDTTWAYNEPAVYNLNNQHWSPHIYWYDKNNLSIGGITLIESINAHYMLFRLFPKSSDLSRKDHISLNFGYNKTNDYAFLEIPNIDFSKNLAGTIAVNINALNDLSNNVVHKTGDETIYGDKKIFGHFYFYYNQYIVNNDVDTNNLSDRTTFTARDISVKGKDYEGDLGRLRFSYHGELSDPTTNTGIYAYCSSDSTKTNSFFISITNSGTKKASLDSSITITGDVIPGGTITNNASTYNLGQTTARWNNLWLASSAFNGSDERIKQDVNDIPEAVLRAWGKVKFKQFKLKASVAKKGSNARLHVGVIAQRIVEAFRSENLDAFNYGLIGFDKWEDKYEDVVVKVVPEVVEEYEETIPAVYKTEYDENGNELQILEKEEQRVKRTRVVRDAVEETERRLVVPAGDLYSVRYDECLALECAYQRWRLDQIEKKLANI